MHSIKYVSEKTDMASLAMVALIKDRFQEAETVMGSACNIYTVFFHDLMIHFSGILMHRIAREHYDDPPRFPRINKFYALSPYPVDTAELVPFPSGQKFKTLLRELPFSHAALGDALPFGDGQDWVMSKVINLLGSYKPFVCAYLRNQEEQIDWLLGTVNEICQIHEIKNGNIIWENWRRYVKFHTTDKQDVLRERGLLLGTRNNLQNRKLAVNFLQQDKEVTALSHGEVANSVMDEPPFGYSERTLCTTLVDYGDFDDDGEYNAPLIRPVHRFYRSSPVVSQHYHQNECISRPDFSRCRILYIPTTYSGNDLYGPFHIYEDAIYRQWQSLLFEMLAGLTMKVHPKSKGQHLHGIAIEQGRLEECIPNYDLLVFDYFSTGGMLALISEKPVIYFDIGLRRLAPRFSRDLVKRCEYVKIDLCADVRRQITEAISSFWSSDREWSNVPIARYAICEENRFRWSDLLRAISAGVPPSW